MACLRLGVVAFVAFTLSMKLTSFCIFSSRQTSGVKPMQSTPRLRSTVIMVLTSGSSGSSSVVMALYLAMSASFMSMNSGYSMLTVYTESA